MSSTKSMSIDCSASAKQLTRAEDIPQAEMMCPLSQLSDNKYEQKAIKGSLGVQIVVDGHGMFVSPSTHTSEGVMETLVPRDAVLVRDTSNELVYLPAVAGG